jgi:NAD-dependent deacetylase sirtuin 2
LKQTQTWIYFRLLLSSIRRRCTGWHKWFNPNSLQTSDLNGIAEYIVKANVKNIIVMTGAGISTNANIPDFRSESFGLYNRLQKYNLPHPTAVFSLDYFIQDPRPFYDIAHELYPVISASKPTTAHYFIKLLDDKGVLLRHYTQNIDGLEELTGLSDLKTIQAHGHIRSGSCLNCSKAFSFDYIKSFVVNNKIPICDSCSNTIKPDVVLFGEALPSAFWKNLDDFPKCDLLIIMGTSLVVQPFASLAGKVNNCPRLLINRDEVGDANMFGSFFTSLLGLDPNFDAANKNLDVFYQGDCDQGCLELCKLLGWENELLELIKHGNQMIDQSNNLNKL